MIEVRSDGVPACGLDVIRGVLQDEPRTGDMLKLDNRQLDQVVRGLYRTFSNWATPEAGSGVYRAMLELPDPFADPTPIKFDSSALFAHEVVLRDPLDHWLWEFDWSGTERRSISLSALEDAVQQASPLQALVDRGELILAPTPPSVWSEDPVLAYFDARGLRAEPDAPESVFSDVELQAQELLVDPDFAAAVLGHPVGEDWRVALEGSDDPEEELDWQMRGEPSPTDEERGNVHIAANKFALRSEYAVATDASLLPTDRVENALIERTLSTMHELSAVTTSRLLHGTHIGNLRGLSPRDVMAIREEEALGKWRDWLQGVSSAAALAELKGLGHEQDAFDAEMTAEIVAALTDATRSESLRRFMQAEGALIASTIAINGIMGHASPRDVGGFAWKVAKAFLRPRAEGHRSILVRLVDRG